MKDRYGRKFKKEHIKNDNMVDILNLKALNEITDEEISRDGVLIFDPQNGAKLYLISDLQNILSQNFYSRLEDPLSKLDILAQVPDFKPALQLNQNSAHYNAYILNKNPEFISLLQTYVIEILHVEDEHRFIDADRNDIRANRSEALDKFYETIANFTPEKQKEFYSLFITSRNLYSDGNLWTFPAKWVPDANDPEERRKYQRATQAHQYTPFAHPNVLINDLINDPETGCMHSWGMDVLYLLLEYHIGTNQPFKLFDVQTNPASYRMERQLTQRIKQKITPGSVNPQLGKELFEKAQQAVANAHLAMPVIIQSTSTTPLSDEPLVDPDTSVPTHKREYINAEETIDKLEKACGNYLDYITAKVGVEKTDPYPSPNQLGSKDNLIVKKYKAVFELYSSLKNNKPGADNNSRITQFIELYNQKNRQAIIAEHRDGAGIRLLNIVFSVLTLGIKNLLTNYSTGGYYGFWNSRGANLNENLEAIIDKTLRI